MKEMNQPELLELLELLATKGEPLVLFLHTRHAEPVRQHGG